MNIEYSLEIHLSHARITAQGEVRDAAEVLGYAQAIADELEKLDIRNVLVDHRKITGTMDPAVGADIAKALSDNVRGVETRRLAVVTSQERFQFLKLFETMARNRGLMILAFDTIDDALHWLEG